LDNGIEEGVEKEMAFLEWLNKRGAEKVPEASNELSSDFFSSTLNTDAALLLISLLLATAMIFTIGYLMGKSESNNRKGGAKL